MTHARTRAVRACALALLQAAATAAPAATLAERRLNVGYIGIDRA